MSPETVEAIGQGGRPISGRRRGDSVISGVRGLAPLPSYARATEDALTLKARHDLFRGPPAPLGLLRFGALQGLARPGPASADSTVDSWGAGGWASFAVRSAKAFGA